MTQPVLQQATDSPAAGTHDPYGSQVAAEATRLFLGGMPTVVVSALLIPILTVIVMWQSQSRAALGAWLAAIVVVAAARLWLGAEFRRRNPPAESTERWVRMFILTSALNGLLWGIAVIVFYSPESVARQVFLLTCVIGLATGSLTVAMYRPSVCFAFAVPALTLSALRHALEGGPGYIGLAVLTLMFIGLLAALARRMHRDALAAIRLRFENLDLVRDLSAQRDAAERANVAKSKFLAAASHDLRQPLHALTLFTTALGERISRPEEARLVDNINVSVHALEQLFNALLDISRLDAGVLQPAVRHFSLRDIQNNLLNDYRPEADRKGITLICAPCDAVVKSDPVLLERILRNLVSNAVRYTERGEVRIDCVPEGDTVRIEVSDTGAGIPAEQHRAIFEEFTQLHNPERDRTKGLGLGLAIVDRLARLLGHPVGLRSAPGAGSCFTVDVPMGDAARVQRDPDRPRDPALNDVTGLRVLVLDDEIGIRGGMQALLEQWGCSVAAGGSEEEAVRAVRASGAAPEAIIADYRLRDGRTGVQAIARLHSEFGQAIPALIISGDTAPDRLREVAGSGFQLVHKPVQPAALRAFLRNARQRRRPQTLSPAPNA